MVGRVEVPPEYIHRGIVGCNRDCEGRQEIVVCEDLAGRAQEEGSKACLHCSSLNTAALR